MIVFTLNDKDIVSMDNGQEWVAWILMKVFTRDAMKIM